MTRLLPPGWISTTLGECFDWGSGGTPRKSVADFYDGGIPWAVIGDLNDGIVDGTRSSISQAGLDNSSAKWIAPGSVLLAMYGSIGKLGIASGPLTTNQAIAHTHPGPVPTRYLFWYLRRIREDLTSQGKGGTQQNISQTVIKAFPFPLAPLPEQHRIVVRIESLFARLDDGVAALKRAEANLKHYRASVLKAAVEGRLTEQWRKENPSEENGEELLGRILAERRRRWDEEQLAKFEAKGRKPPQNWKAKYNEPLEPDTGSLPELPDGWCWSTVDQLASVTGGLTKNPARSGLPIRYPYLRVANVYADEFRLDDVRTIGVSESELDRVVLRPGDLLIVEGNGSAEQIGRVAQWQGDLEPCCHQNHLIKVRCAPSASRSRWMLLWLLSLGGRRAVLEKASSTSGLYTLSLSKVRALPVPLAPIREQVRAIRLADSLCDTSRDVRDQVEAKMVIRASALRQSILKRAFDGRLVPQDPNDESASALLERIRAERDAEKQKRRRASNPKHKRKGQVA
ncbi:restriction endonuclease subunit S [Candidatus Palauibacter sp.]|uniref:restriction endonuclease subunit S n=1 Tax=Candidatus Palauibacter sp. TaxID=3101350 RepID=UPI003D11035E